MPALLFCLLASTGLSDPPNEGPPAEAVDAFVSALVHTDFFDKEVTVQFNVTESGRSISFSRYGAKPDLRYAATLSLNANGETSQRIVLPAAYKPSAEPERHEIMNAYIASSFTLYDRSAKYKLSLMPVNREESEWLVFIRLYPLNVIDNFVSLMARRQGSHWLISED